MCGLSAQLTAIWKLGQKNSKPLSRLSFFCSKCPIADDFLQNHIWFVLVEFGRNESVAQMVDVWPGIKQLMVGKEKNVVCVTCCYVV